MKKSLLPLLSAFLLLLMMTAASAMTQQEWDEICKRKTARDATAYSITWESQIATTGDMNYTETVAHFSPIGVLSAGTYVSVVSPETDGKYEVSYWTGGGVKQVWIDADAMVWATVTVKGTNGKTYTIPEKAMGNPDAIRRGMWDLYDEAELQAIIDGMMQWGAAKPSGSKKKAAPVSSVKFAWTDEDGETQQVTVQKLGLVDTVIALERETLTVPTATLQWEADVPADHAMAVIDAPRSGAASLRAKASSKGKVLKKCKTNRIVLVLDVGMKYTKILYDGVEGYVLTSALNFYPVGGMPLDEAGEAAQAQRGWISFRGKLNSRNTVNIRMNGKNGSRILGDFKAGTPVAIFSQTERWTEIEVEGYRAFILSEYVTLDDGEEE